MNQHPQDTNSTSVKKTKLIFLLLFITPLFADAIYSLTEFRIGILYRGLAYIAILSYITLLPLRRYKTLTFLCFYPLILALGSSLFYGALTLGLTEAAKYSYPFAMTIFFLSKSKAFNKLTLLNCITNLGFVASLLILIPYILGIGKPTYFEGAYGNKGFFSAQNDISITLAICLVLSAYQYTSSRSTTSLIKSTLIALSLLVLGTRLAMISALIIPICFIFQLRFKSIAIVALTLIVFASPLYNIVADYLSFSAYENQKFETMSSLGDKGRITLLTGANRFFENRSIIAHIFGSGTFEYLNQTFKNLSFLQLEGDMKAVEMDPIDLFGQFGIIYTVALYVFISSFIIRLLKLPTKTKETKSIIIALILALLNSIFVGHTINNAILAPVVASLLSMATIILRERSKKNEYTTVGKTA